MIAVALGAIILTSTGLLTVISIILFAQLPSYKRELHRLPSTDKLGSDREGIGNRSIRGLENILSRQVAGQELLDVAVFTTTLSLSNRSC